MGRDLKTLSLCIDQKKLPVRIFQEPLPAIKKPIESSKTIPECTLQEISANIWIPKYGDPDEFPLTPQEVDKLRRYSHVEIQYPEIVFFSLI
jgi:hypothetical protein